MVHTQQIRLQVQFEFFSGQSSEMDGAGKDESPKPGAAPAKEDSASNAWGIHSTRQRSESEGTSSNGDDSEQGKR